MATAATSEEANATETITFMSTFLHQSDAVDAALRAVEKVGTER
jgi:hypothetical protein